MAKKSQEQWKKEGEHLKSLFAAARKKEHNCAVMICAEGLAIEADPRLPHENLERKAKTWKGATPKGILGNLKVNGTNIEISCLEEPPGGMEIKFKQYLSKVGLKMKPVLIPPPGEERPVEDAAPVEEVEDEEEIEGDIGTLLKKARKKPHNVAWLIGDKTLVLKAHPRHPVEKLRQQAKSEGGGPRGACGVMTVTGKTVNLHCEDEPPKSFARLAKVWMANQDYVYKVKVVLPDGSEIDSDEEEAAAEDTDLPELSKSELAVELKHVVEVLKLRFDNMPPDHVKTLKAALKGCAASISNGDLVTAKNTLNKIGLLIGVTGETPIQPLEGAPPPEAKAAGAPPAAAGPEGDEPGVDGPGGEEPTPGVDPPPENVRELSETELPIANELSLAVKTPGLRGNFKVIVTKDYEAEDFAVECYRQLMEFKLGRDVETPEAYKFASERQLPLIYFDDEVPHLKGKPFHVDQKTSVGMKIVEQGFVLVKILPLEMPEFDEDTRARLKALVDAMSPEERKALFDAVDKDFYALTQYLEGEAIPSPKDPMADTWWDLVYQAMAAREAFEDVPDSVKRFFPPFEEGGPQRTPSTLKTILRVAEKIESLSPEDLASIDEKLMALVTDPNLIEKVVNEKLVEIDIRENTAMGAFTWISRPKRKVGHNAGIDIHSTDQASLTFDDKDAAIRFARRIEFAAAVVKEGGEFLVFKVEYDDGDLELFKVWTEASSTTQSNIRTESGVVAIVSLDDYVFDIQGGVGFIQRTGGGGDPYAEAVEAYGDGMKLITDRTEFEQKFETVMRDAAHRAVDDAERAIDGLEDELKDNLLSDSDQQRMDAVLKKIVKLEEKIAAEESKIKDKKEEIRKLEDLVAKKIEEHSIKESEELSDDIIALEKIIEERKREIAPNVDEITDLGKKIHAEKNNFPLLQRVGEMRDFKSNLTAFDALNPTAQGKIFKKIVGDISDNVKDTRKSLERGEFNYYAMPGLVEKVSSGVGLEGEQAKWAKNRSAKEHKSERNKKLAEAVVSIGLAVGSSFVGGPAGFAMAVGAMGVGAHDAISTTEEYYRETAAANIALDPEKGLLGQGVPPEWYEVGLAWLGVGLDVADIAVAAVKLSKAGVSAAEIASKTPDELAESLRGAGLKQNVDTFAKRAVAAVGESNLVRDIEVTPMNAGRFDARYKNPGAQATVELHPDGEGGYVLNVTVREGADPEVVRKAIAEEVAHVEQFADPELLAKANKLNEEALSEWPSMSRTEKLDAFTAKMELEADAQTRLIIKAEEEIDAINREIQTLSKDVDALDANAFKKLQDLSGRKQRLQGDIQEALETQEQYLLMAAESDVAKNGDELPKWMDIDTPPRLHNQPKEKLLDDLSDAEVDEWGENFDNFYDKNMHGPVKPPEVVSIGEKASKRADLYIKHVKDNLDDSQRQVLQTLMGSPLDKGLKDMIDKIQKKNKKAFDEIKDLFLEPDGSLKSNLNSFDEVWNQVAARSKKSQEEMQKVREKLAEADALEAAGDANLAEQLRKEAKALGKKAYTRLQKNYWKTMRSKDNAHLMKLFELTGMDTSGGGAPRFIFEGNLREGVTLEHFFQKSLFPERAVDPGNLLFSPSHENSFILEKIRKIEDEGTG